MAGFIPEEIVEQVQNRSDIIEIISAYIPLKRVGSNFKAPCPFHNEKTPSFIVNPAKQIWHCFGCGLGGNVFSFVMRHEKLEFPDTVRFLAGKAGVEIPLSYEGGIKKQSKNKSLYRINELAAGYFQNNLADPNKGKLARQYLDKRGVSPEVIRKFRLGFALNQWDGFLRFAKAKGESEDLLKTAGLIIPRKDRGYYDHFRGRLIFPILDLQDRVLAFGGRVLDASLPKYINSPQNPLFNKGRCLYGLNTAKESLRGKEHLIIVEGYMDLITLYRMGVRNVIAALGTALTSEHARLLKRYVPTAVMVYDADQAGETASLRGLEILIEGGLRVKVVRLPEGFDPDSFIITRGKEGFEKAVVDGEDLFDYKLGLLTSKYNAEKLEEASRITAEMLPTISRIDNAVLKSGYISKLARRLSINENSLLIELKRIKQKGVSNYQSQRSNIPGYNFAINVKEKFLIGLMLEDFKIAAQVKNCLALDDFKDPGLKQIVAAIFRLISEKKKFSCSQVINYLKDDRASQIIAGISASSEIAGYTDKQGNELSDKKKVVADCIEKIKAESLKQARLDLQRKIKLAEETRDDKKRMRLLSEFKNLIKI
ncbi:MAG: DNA primase [Candidatus Omnitrophota bacterium]|nr:DNA primase [Candidatus Omnitrophota bacterium]